MKIIGLRIEKYIDKEVSGHNCDFEYNDAEFEKHIICGVLSDNRKVEIELSHSEGECGSGWTTACKWDTIIPFEPLWAQYKRIIKDNGAIVLFGSQPFTSALVMSNVKWFKYEWIWEKPKTTGHALSKIQPMKAHENILVFGNGKITYNPQFENGEPYKGRNKPKYKESEEFSTGYGNRNDNNGFRFPRSVQFFRNTQYVDIQVHPTQKPKPMIEYLIKTYSNENEVILDNCMGSGTTAVACINTNRNYIGFEMDKTYFDIAQKRIQDAKTLFSQHGA